MIEFIKSIFYFKVYAKGRFLRLLIDWIEKILKATVFESFVNF